MTFAFLQRAKGAHVAQDPVEIVLAADRQIGGAVGGVERHSEFVETRPNHGPAILLVEKRAVGIEQHVDATLLEVTDHSGQVLDEHRLADTVQHGALRLRHLVDNRGEQLPAHVGGRLEFDVGAWARRTKQVAAVGGLEIEADRWTLDTRRTVTGRSLVVAARVDDKG